VPNEASPYPRCKRCGRPARFRVAAGILATGWCHRCRRALGQRPTSDAGRRALEECSTPHPEVKARIARYRRRAARGLPLFEETRA
jgi:hypothetical protein